MVEIQKITLSDQTPARLRVNILVVRFISDSFPPRFANSKLPMGGLPWKFKIRWKGDEPYNQKTKIAENFDPWLSKPNR